MICNSSRVRYDIRTKRNTRKSLHSLMFFTECICTLLSSERECVCFICNRNCRNLVSIRNSLGSNRGPKTRAPLPPVTSSILVCKMENVCRILAYLPTLLSDSSSPHPADSHVVGIQCSILAYNTLCV